MPIREIRGLEISARDLKISVFNFQFSFFLGVPAVAVGLSAVSFSAALQKDAASIPNALGAARTQSPPYILINKVYFF